MKKLTTSSKTQKEIWKRTWNPPRRVRRKDSEKKTLKNSMSTSRWRPCAETQLGETSRSKEKKESSITVHAHKTDACESRGCRISEKWQAQARRAHCRPRNNLVHMPIPSPIPKATKIPEAKVEQIHKSARLARIQSKKQKKHNKKAKQFLRTNVTYSRSTKGASYRVVMQ